MILWFYKQGRNCPGLEHPWKALKMLQVLPVMFLQRWWRMYFVFFTFSWDFWRIFCEAPTEVLLQKKNDKWATFKHDLKPTEMLQRGLHAPCASPLCLEQRYSEWKGGEERCESPPHQWANCYPNQAPQSRKKKKKKMEPIIILWF